MYSNLKTFDTIRFYKSWTILGSFYRFFHFLIQIWIWKTLAVFTGRYRYHTEAVKTVTAVTGAVTVGIKNHASASLGKLIKVTRYT
jgi:hypothetical protein